MSYVYRAFDDDGSALYVGFTENLPLRLRQHARQSEWFVLLARFEIDRCGSREDGQALECAEIARLRPSFNERMVPGFQHVRRSFWAGKRPQVEKALPGGYAEFAADCRAQGDSWRRIARKIEAATGVEITGMTAQKWAQANPDEASAA